MLFLLFSMAFSVYIKSCYGSHAWYIFCEEASEVAGVVWWRKPLVVISCVKLDRENKSTRKQGDLPFKLNVFFLSNSISNSTTAGMHKNKHTVSQTHRRCCCIFGNVSCLILIFRYLGKSNYIFLFLQIQDRSWFVLL